jgi:hypothetical protein
MGKKKKRKKKTTMKMLKFNLGFFVWLRVEEESWGWEVLGVMFAHN